MQMRVSSAIAAALAILVPFSAYAGNGRVMGAGNLAACNRLAEGDRAKVVAAK